MKYVSSITVCVVDFGLFLPVAMRLARDCKRVLYHYPPCLKGFPTLGSSIIGDGFESIERVEEFWPFIDEIDCFVFPDIGMSKLQLYLESIGKSVWGARDADSIETNRAKFNRILGEIGLDVPKCETITGLTNLRLYLKDKTDKYIKISKFRGDIETTHWRDYDSDSVWLDSLAIKFGPAMEFIPFMVFEPIDAPTEVGGDGYNIDGQWPSLMLHGHEAKDKCYLGAVTPFDDMPEELKKIMNAFSPVFEKYLYRSEFSMETRRGVFTDPTCRGGLPSTGSQLETWENFSDIVWYGANGILVEPIPAYQFSVECILSVKSKPDQWAKVRIEPDMMDNCKFAACCEIDDAICFPPDGDDDNDVGWLVAGGDTMEEAIENIQWLASRLPDGLTAATEELVGLIDKIKEGEEAGAEFSKDEVPEPEIALEIK